MEERLACIDQIVGRIRAEFLEMPGLRLTLCQAKRLWGLDEERCAQVLELLIADRCLVRKADGTYARLTNGSVQYPARAMVKADLPTTAVRTTGPARSQS
jgi:hypothetical protein